MFIAFASLLAIIIGLLLIKKGLSHDPEKKRRFPPLIAKFAPFLLVFLGIFGLISCSFLTVDSNEVGLMKRIYLAPQLPPGKIIAANEEKGPQAEILGPGFHFKPFIRILYDIDFAPVTEIPEGQYGLLVARDGLPLEEGQFLAHPWPEGKFTDMLEAKHFLTAGKGQKGPQLDVLKPGKYRLNNYLFSVESRSALDVPTGHVAVIRSNVQTRMDCTSVVNVTGRTGETVATPVVPKGCVGVWDEPLPPGRYYLNEKAYVATIIPTRLQTWTYVGGYTERKINLRVTSDGKILQEEIAREFPVPANAADRSITVRVEGWTVPVDMRVVVQVHPKNAPKVVASVGDLQRVEDNIITPAIRDILRTIGGHRDRKVLDFVENRGEIVELVEKSIAIEGEKAGVTIQEVRMGEPAIPPELLVATLREQLATQLNRTYQKEREAQKERISVERERASADQQHTLVKAEIQKQAAAHRMEQLRLEGEGQKLKLMEIAKGQKALADVLGKDHAMQLQALEKALDAARANPDLVKVPVVQVNGSGSGYEGAAAVLGASNIVQMMEGMEKKQKKGAKK
jgi:regulator of protease activity HflC (stomatin/prohibitin superfamily)